jgi:hypothetical protein
MLITRETGHATIRGTKGSNEAFVERHGLAARAVEIELAVAYQQRWEQETANDLLTYMAPGGYCDRGYRPRAPRDPIWTRPS